MIERSHATKRVDPPLITQKMAASKDIAATWGGGRAEGAGRPAAGVPRGPGRGEGKKGGDNPRVRVLQFACVNSGQACAVRVRELDGDDFETI